MIHFALAKINTDQFAIIDSAFKKAEDVKLKIGLQFGANRESKIISVKISIEFEHQANPFLIVEASCFFNIESNDWNSFIMDKEIVVPQSVITQFAVLTVGTLRGILHAKTEGTNYNGFVIPTINLTELITGDIRL